LKQLVVLLPLILQVVLITKFILLQLLVTQLLPFFQVATFNILLSLAVEQAVVQILFVVITNLTLLVVEQVVF
jgi:hypothetical protein